MKVLVSCKRVPNPEQKLKFASGAIDLSGASWQVNPFDEYAVETALRLTEKGKGGERVGEVVLVGIGPKDMARELRGLLAMGADRGLLVAGEDDRLDADLVARVLCAVVAAERPDLVIMGKQAVDGDSNQAGQILAGHLGWPQATCLASVVLDADGRAATVTREVDSGAEEKRVRLPAVLTVDLRIIGKRAVRHAGLADLDAEWEDSQRYASLKGIMAAKKKEIREIAMESLGLAGGLRVKTRGHAPPPVRKPGVKVASVEELVHKLRTEAKVL